MNISPLTIYLWQLADSLKSSITALIPAFFVITVVLIIPIAISTVCAAERLAEAEKYPNSYSDEKAKAAAERHTNRITTLKPWLIRSFIAGLFTVLLSALIPTSNTIAMMAVIPEIAHSKVIQTDLPDLYEIAIKALKEQIAPKK